MILRARLGAAFFGLFLAVALLPAPFDSQAYAAGPVCNATGTQTGSQVFSLLGSCTSGGSGGTGAGPSGGGSGKTKDPTYQTVERHPDQKCKDANGRDSYMGVIWDPKLQQTYDWCLLQPGGGGGGNAGANVVDKTQLQINAPKPTADFAERFLTGAEVTFSVPQMTSYAQSLQQFPGASINATPTKMAWDFGDGTQSSDISPKHTYLTRTPDQNKPNDHVAHIRVTGTWHLYLHPAGATAENPLQDLGEVSLTGQLDRPIVEVWSAQTEPKTNA